MCARRSTGSFSPENTMQAWMESTFRTASCGLSGNEWCNADPPVPDLPTLFLVKSRSAVSGTVQADIVLRSHHDVIDGMGTLHLFNNLFTHASRAYKEQSAYQLPTFDSEWHNLSPLFRVAAAIPLTLPLFRVYETYYLQHYLSGYSPFTVAWIGSIQAFAQFSATLISGPITDHFGPMVQPRYLLFTTSL